MRMQLFRGSIRFLPIVLYLLLGPSFSAHAEQAKVGGNLSQVDNCYYSGTSMWANVLNNFCAFHGGPLTPDGFPMNNDRSSGHGGWFQYAGHLWPDGAWTLRYRGDAENHATVSVTCEGRGLKFAELAPKKYDAETGFWTIPLQFSGSSAGTIDLRITYAKDGLGPKGIATDPVHGVELTCNHWYPDGIVPAPLPLFSKPFLERMKPFSTLRFMMQMNAINWAKPTLCIHGVDNKGRMDTDGNFIYGDYDPKNPPTENSFDFNSPYGVGRGAPMYLPMPGKNDDGHKGYQKILGAFQCLAGSKAAPAEIHYPMNGRYCTLTGRFGKDIKGENDSGTLLFEVWADGTQLYPVAGDPATPMKAGDQFRTFFIDVAGRNELTLKVYDPDPNGPTSKNWADFSVGMWNLASWESRPSAKVFYSTQANGTAFEKLVQLCNASNSDGWFHIPVTASDDFAVKLAYLLLYGADADGHVYTSKQEHPHWPPLKSNLNAYIEYGNEEWNQALGPGPSYLVQWAASRNGARKGAAAQYAERVKKIGDVMKPLFAAAGLGNNLKMVLGGQICGGPQENALKYIAEKYGPPKQFYDVLAVAPYFGLNANSFSAASTLDQVLATFEFGTEKRNMDGGGLCSLVIPWIKTQAELAKSYDLKLVAYEGGESTYRARASDQAITLCWQAQHATRMGALYDQLLQAWAQYAGDGVFLQYTLIENAGTTLKGLDPSKYTMFFGALDQCNELGSMKYDALCRNSHLAGDADCDGTVSYADFITLKSNFGLGQSGSPSASWWLSTDKPAFWSQGDFNNDQIVDIADFWLMYKNLSVADRARPDVAAFVTEHPNPVMLPQLWPKPIALTMTGNTGGITTWTGVPASVAIRVDRASNESDPVRNFVLNVVQAPRHGTLTLKYPYVTYTPNDAYTGIDDFWVSTKDETTGLNSNKVWIPVNVREVRSVPDRPSRD